MGLGFKKRDIFSLFLWSPDGAILWSRQSISFISPENMVKKRIPFFSPTLEMDPTTLTWTHLVKKLQFLPKWVPKLPPISFQEKKKKICVLKNLVTENKLSQDDPGRPVRLIVSLFISYYSSSNFCSFPNSSIHRHDKVAAMTLGLLESLHFVYYWVYHCAKGNQ